MTDRLEIFFKRSSFAMTAETLFDWHERPGAFERLQPPADAGRILDRSGTIRDGDRLTMLVPLGPFRVRWTAEHSNYQYGRQFVDVQVRGPFSRWEHTHRFTPLAGDSCLLEDSIRFCLPFHRLTWPLVRGMIRRKLERLFEYRHRILEADLAAIRSLRGRSPMHILVSGSNGLVGSSLIPFLSTAGHKISRLVRSAPRGANEIPWDPDGDNLPIESLEGLDAVVHLAGENIAEGRWTETRKRRILESRTRGTGLLARALSRLSHPPKVFVCASAIGFYGSRAGEKLREDSPAGTGFLADVCRAWESASVPAAERGIRTVNVRIGMVLSPSGGALAKMLTPFRMGVGGVIGNGNQYWSWIALEDLVGVLHHCITTEQLEGPVNAVAPEACTNREFTRTLAQVLGRPALFPVPRFAARLAFGEMADALLLSSARVQPVRLTETGYQFRLASLREALQVLLGR